MIEPLQIIKPIEPVGANGKPLSGWRLNSDIPAPGNAWPIKVWDYEYGVRALSGIYRVEEPDHPEASGPHYHVSFTRWYKAHGEMKGPLRIDSVDAAYVLSEFFGGFQGWEEDNHVNAGKARNFWRPVDESRIGSECFCKKHEPKIIEDGGDYVWRPL